MSPWHCKGYLVMPPWDVLVLVFSEHKLLSPLQLLSGILLPSGPAGSSVRTTVGVLSSLGLPPDSLGRHFLTLFFFILL